MDTLTKAKIKLLGKSPFIAAVGLGCKHFLEEGIPTAQTDGSTVKYGTEFWNNLNSEEQMGLMAHEIWHVVLSHMHRRGTRNPSKWNKAGDHVINLMLLEQGFKLPEGGLADKNYTGLSTEMVYTRLPDEEDDDSTYGEGPLDDLIEAPEGSKDSAELATKEIIAKAIQSARMSKEYGDLPSEIKRMLDNTLSPKISWQELLVNYMTEKSKDDYSWKKPSRRHQDMFIPSLYSEAMGEMTVAIDTSGSVSHSLVAQFLAEVKAIHEDVQPSKTTILAIDTEIQGDPYIVAKDDIFVTSEINVTSGGGTSFTAAFNYIENNPTQCLIYLTDGYADTNLDDPSTDVLWLIYDNDNFTPPFGTVIYID